MDTNRFKSRTDYGRAAYARPAHPVSPMPTPHAAAADAAPQAPRMSPAPQTQNDSTISIRIIVPQVGTGQLRKLFSWRPTPKQLLILTGLLCMFFVGYQVGWRVGHKPATPAVPAVTYNWRLTSWT